MNYVAGRSLKYDVLIKMINKNARECAEGECCGLNGLI